VPASLYPIMPPQPIISYELDASDHPAFAKAQEFKSMIMAKKSDEEILAVLRSSAEGEPDEYNPELVAIFTAVLLKIASKTFSHSFAALTRYYKTFRSVTHQRVEIQSVILRTLYEVWYRHKQMLSVLVDKMLKMQILEPSVIEAWVFSDEMKREFKRCWIWQVLSTAIRRLEGQFNRMLEEHTKIQKALDDQATEGEDDETENSQRPKIVPPVDESKMETEEIFKGGFEEGKTIKRKELQAKRDESIQKIAEIDDNLRNITLSVCHKFTLILSEHLVNCENDGTEVETEFYQYVIGRFRYIFLTHAPTMWKYGEDLDRELFSKAIDPKILEVFTQFRALKAGQS